MAKKKGATPKGGPEARPQFIETKRYSEIETLADKEQASWGEDGKTPIVAEDPPADDPPPNDPPKEPDANETPSDEGVSVSGDDKLPAGDAPAEKKPDEEIAPPEAPIEPAKDDFDTLIVDGVETKTEKSKIYDIGKQALQKTLHAEKKMQEAAEKVKEADRIIADARKKAEELTKPPEKKPEQVDTGKSDVPLSEDEVAAIVDNIRYGNAEQSKEAVLKLATLGAKATQKPQDVTPIIDKRFDELYDKKTAIHAFESALEQAKRPPEQGGFGDVFDGGPREKVFEYYEGQIAKAEPTLSYSERFKRAGDSTRQALNLNPTKPGSPESDSRQQRKAELENSSTAVSPGSSKPKVQPAKSELEEHTQSLSEIQKQRRGR